jgi:hypothetical protein
LRSAQRCHHKVNGAKEAILFKQYFCLNFDGYLRLHILHRVPCFAAILTKQLPLKESKIICAKAALLWHQKCW